MRKKKRKNKKDGLGGRGGFYLAAPFRLKKESSGFQISPPFLLDLSFFLDSVKFCVDCCAKVKLNESGEGPGRESAKAYCAGG